MTKLFFLFKRKKILFTEQISFFTEHKNILIFYDKKRRAKMRHKRGKNRKQNKQKKVNIEKKKKKTKQKTYND